MSPHLRHLHGNLYITLSVISPVKSLTANGLDPGKIDNRLKIGVHVQKIVLIDTLYVARIALGEPPPYLRNLKFLLYLL